ncbi:DUF962 domain-containing protein [Ketobacter sp. MCCC 1A13808]|uniref:DUF962 domain-containing protein n=1 Tax=Ketobacter sp. MCCC 1A13808 TaxID=2602738 RepID=UPI000F25FE8F|nr:DUF962 domain-containing protein [Ketobacter sp. MCCC 1A13808]MVF12625.1 DUF962 domain-containing protein [Ketobacter sp. MCCC 1A13808]RLP55577.1 MAG: DUF962 domain-containing protein [Ketobacter sp.]
MPEAKEFKSFEQFYPYYLSEHENTTCRRLHFVGSTLVLCLIAYMLLSQTAWLLVLLPFIGYGFAWIGHFFFEKNRPATFTYPWFSFKGDWVMYKDMITGKIPF